MEIVLRDYQIELSNKCTEIIRTLKICYLVAEVRTGKTLTALQTAKNLNCQNVLFVTKKRAIPSIQSDFNAMGYDYNLTVINNESLHKVEGDFDFIISDEHHRNGAYPKPNQVTKLIKQKFSHLPMLFLSGTPHPESYSQIFHQFWVSKYSPFDEVNFYKWAKTYVDVKDRHLGYAVVKDYSNTKYNLIKPIIDKYIVTFTQKQAGFETSVNEHVLKVDMLPMTYAIAKHLQKNKFVKSKDGKMIMADTAVKEMQKLHQIYSGTVILEDGSTRVFDLSKAKFIKEKFKDNKLGIFYKFKAELQALQMAFGYDNITDDLSEFDKSSKHIALQIVSGSEGISLKNADYLVYYNIDFSSKNYWQSRDRMTTMQRKSNDVYWIFSKGGIEEKIYNSVLKKKNYTLSIFKKDFVY
jgi:hypothetical protein